MTGAPRHPLGKKSLIASRGGSSNLGKRTFKSSCLSKSQATRFAPWNEAPPPWNEAPPPLERGSHPWNEPLPSKSPAPPTPLPHPPFVSSGASPSAGVLMAPRCLPCAVLPGMTDAASVPTDARGRPRTSTTTDAQGRPFPPCRRELWLSPCCRVHGCVSILMSAWTQAKSGQ